MNSIGVSADTADQCDVVILGGGLAGLCLARQLQLETQALSIVVIESAVHPVPVAAHKIGESTVEIGAHYLGMTLALKNYLDTHHLKKFGLRCFFGSGVDIAQADELGASKPLPVSSYQLDRGLLENHLVDQLIKENVIVHDGARVKEVEFAEDVAGLVKYSSNGSEFQLNARWVVDATGRQGLFRRQFELKTENDLNGNAVWFRVNQRIRVDDWSSDPCWHSRISSGERWLSTNHFMGQGYWVWLIPLSSGATSIGIVVDAETHPITDFTSFERVRLWLGIHQPQLAAAIDQALGADQPMDFAWLRNYSYGCKNIFPRRRDNQRWALTGEAGLFLDPFYSPGMDFIAYSNTFICDLILRQSAGENIATRQVLYQQTYQSIYESSLDLYRGQYNGFGNFQLMSHKTVWDYAYYWGVLGLLFFNNVLTDTDLLASRHAALAAIRVKHQKLQKLFQDYANEEPLVEPTTGFTDHAEIPLLHRLNSELAEPLSAELVGVRLDANLDALHQLAAEITQAIDAYRSVSNTGKSALSGQ